MKISLTRTDCLSLKVTEAIIARHLGLEGMHFAESIDLLRTCSNRVIAIRTPSFHQNPSQKFVIIVSHTPDEEYEYAADLYQDKKLLKKFWWDFSGSKITLLENSDM